MWCFLQKFTSSSKTYKMIRFLFVFPDQTVMERVTDGRRAAGLHEVGEDHEARKRRRIVSKDPPKLHTGNTQIWRTWPPEANVQRRTLETAKNLTIIHIQYECDIHIHYCFHANWTTHFNNQISISDSVSLSLSDSVSVSVSYLISVSERWRFNGINYLNKLI